MVNVGSILMNGVNVTSCVTGEDFSVLVKGESVEGDKDDTVRVLDVVNFFVVVSRRRIKE